MVAKGFIVVIIPVLLFCMTHCGTKNSQPEFIADKSQRFIIHTDDGKTITSDDLQGKIIILCFVMDYFDESKIALSALKDFYEQASQFNVVLICVYKTDNQQDTTIVQQRAAPIYAIANSHDLFTIYNIKKIPTTVVLNRQGTESARIDGINTEIEYQKNLIANINLIIKQN